MVQAIALFAAGLAIASPPAEEEAPATAENFVVVGRVLTADGDRPMEGVRVWASTGMGSLGVSGETKTDADGRFRLDFPGQGVAIVGVEKPGWHGRPHGSRPQYLLSQRPLDPKEVAEKYTNLVAGQPTPVEFRMEPAAQLKGHLIGPDGKPMANARLWLTGEALRLGGSVIADTKTDAEGRFAVQDVPRSPYRLVLVGDPDRGQADLVLGSIHFRDPVEYTVIANVQEWTPQSTQVTFRAARGADR